MSRKTLFISLGIILVLLAGTIWVGRASAAVSCFGDIAPGYWAEEFICWLKANGISSGYDGVNFGPENNIKRSEMAKMLFKQVEIPPSSGAIVVNIGFSDWYVAADYGNPILIKYPAHISFGKNGLGNQALAATPTIPISLYGRDLALTGFQLCYDVSETRGYMDTVTMYVLSMDPSGVGVEPTVEASSGMSGYITNAACVVFNLPMPVVMDINSQILINIFTYNSDPGEVIRIGRASLTFEPTTTLHVP